VVVQPLVGLLSDRSHIRLGRRRPFIIGGTIGVVASLLALAWIEAIAGRSSNGQSVDQSSSTTKHIIISIAILLIYTLNTSIQPLQAGLRTLIVENCPKHQQTQASAWAGGMTGVGNIVGYLFGFAALPSLFRLEHWTQFQCLCVIASLSLVITTTLSCSIVEQHFPSRQPDQLEWTGVATVLSDLIGTYRSMPARVRNVCHIQFCAWMGWFPFLFYSTTYVGEFYSSRVTARQLPAASFPNINANIYTTRNELTSTPEEKNGLSQEAIRFGTFASFLFAIVALIANVTLPLLMRTFQKASPSSTGSSKTQIPRLWTFGHFFFFLAMLATFFVTSQAGATFVIASVGISWALTLWAPFAIIGNELAARRSLRDTISDISSEEASPISRDIQAGAIMGLHNVAISAPQIIAALACSGIFGLAKLMGSQNGTSWVLRAGGCAALGAAYLTSKFED
jgi:solute carrier family 45 protein 1/2/4